MRLRKSGYQFWKTQMAKSILHIITEPTGGGAERLVRELNKILPRYGVKSSILFLKNPTGVQLFEREECLSLGNKRNILAPLKLRQYLSRYDPKCTVLHGHLVDALYLLAIPFVAKNFQKVYTEHSTHNRRRNIPYFYFIERYVYLKFIKIVCISNAVRKNLLEWLKFNHMENNLYVIYNGSRQFTKNYYSGSPELNIRFLSVGSLKWEKGFDLAIQAFSKIDALKYSYKIVGEGPERKNLEKLIFKYGLEDKIKLIGSINECIESYFWSSDAQIIPSRWEGFGLVAVEGMSAGLPIVASNVDGLNEVVSKVSSTIFFDPDSIDDLSRAINKMLSKRPYFSKYFEESTRVSREFSYDQMAKNYSKFYLAL